MNSRGNLAVAYREAGRIAEAIPLFERTVAARERVLGADHPDTINSRNNLAAAYREAGRVTEAIPLVEQTLAARERLLGADHPSTLNSRNNLAAAYREAGRVTDAIPLFEQNLAACERLLGADHQRTIGTRNNLAVAYRDAGRAARRSRCTSRHRPPASGSEEQTTREPRAQGTTSQRPTGRREGSLRRSCCSSRPWPAGNESWASTIPTP